MVVKMTWIKVAPSGYPNKEKYREIIRQAIRQLILKKAKEEKEGKLNKTKEDRYNWIISNLLADLADYETEGRRKWLREPKDRLWERARSFKSIHPFFEDFFEDFFDF